MSERWAPFVLYLEGLVTLWIGWRSAWVDYGEPGHDRDFTSWRNHHLVSNIGAGASLLAGCFAFGLLCVGVSWLVRALQRRPVDPSPEVFAAGIASAVLASIGLACAGYMTYCTYQYAGGWVSPLVLERSDAPLARATVTFAPWLVIGGHASVLAAGVWLSRIVRVRRATS